MTKVVIGDEDFFIRKAMCQIIEKECNLKVEKTFCSGLDIVNYCKENKPDIVLMDIKLQELDGLEAARQIKEISKDIDICIISAYQNLFFVKKALKLDIKEYLTKPVTKKMLVNLLEEYNTKTNDYSNILSQVRNVIDARDYHMVYEKPKEIASEIFEKSGHDKLKAGKILQSIQKDVISHYMNKEIDCEKVAEKIPVNQDLLEDEIVIEMWITKFLDYIYKFRFGQRYESVKPVLDYIDENVKDYINMQAIVDNCHISQQYILRLFKEQLKMSTLEYIQNRKMMLAKWYFYFGEYSTLDVAVMLGFGDAGYFSKVFKKFEHITPFQYKTNIKADYKQQHVL